MADLRLQRLAQVLVQYSLGLKPGERLAIEAGAQAAPLVRAVVREALRAGAYPDTFISLSGVREILLKDGSEEQLRYIPPADRLLMGEYDTLLHIAAQENTKHLSGIDPARLALARQATRELMETYIQRLTTGSLRDVMVLFPTNAYAQDADMSLEELEEFVSHACFLDEEDPVACWQQLSRQQERLVQWLKGKHLVHLRGPETDLTFSIEGRRFLNDDGHENLPGGEVFTSPVEDSANGFIHFSFPASYGGRRVADIRLRFEHGVVVEAQATQGQDYLEQMLSLDEGARRLGEFAFGNNPRVDRCIQQTLFDEKIGGTIHLALGASIPETGGVNQSALHWDLVCDLRQSSEIRVDGEVFCHDGKFIV